MYNVMIVDDKEIFRRRFKRFKVFTEKSKKFSVDFEAKNGIEAYEILKKEKISLVITDIRMPLMDGIELLKKIKEEKLCQCVVLLSEYADFSYAKEGLVLGAFDYCIKPIDESKLEELLLRAEVFLSELTDKENYSLNEVRILVPVILQNDSDVLSIGEKIADKVLIEKGENDIKAIEKLSEIFEAVKKKIEEEKPTVNKYSNLKKFTLDIDYKSLDAKKCFCKSIESLSREVNKFNFNCKSTLIKSICSSIVEDIESGVSLQEVADAHFVNKAYLSHIFKQETGMTYVDFITMVKMERAKILLENTDMKIYEIANALRYDDSEYFSRIFKNYTQLTPTFYRQKVSGKNAS